MWGIVPLYLLKYNEVEKKGNLEEIDFP